MRGAVPLSKVKKKGREWKSAIIERTRTLCDEYPDLYVFRYRNVRTECFKELREARPPSPHVSPTAASRTAF